MSRQGLLIQKIKTIDELAIFGSPPTFQELLHVGRPNIGDRERLFDRINDLLDRRWLTNHGPLVEELEKEISNRLGVKHCIALCNGTVALEIAIRGLGLQGEVIVPSFTFIATAHALQWLGVTPVFCDIHPATHNLDPRCVEQLVTPQTSAILGVHVWGRPCAVEELAEIARRRNLRLLFDAAHAFGCSHNGRMIGSFGDLEVLSFHATKFFNTFEGGAIVTNEDGLAQKIRLMSNFGFSGYDQVEVVGTNGKMSEAAAAMGLTGLESLDEFIAVNCRNYHVYRSELSGIPGLKMAAYDEREKNNYQYIIFEVDEKVTGISRDLLVEILHAENVLARRYFYPGCHQMQPYRTLFPEAGLRLPETEALTQRCLSLPNGTAVSSEDIAHICQIIRLVIANSAEIRRELGR